MSVLKYSLYSSYSLIVSWSCPRAPVGNMCYEDLLPPGIWSRHTLVFWRCLVVPRAGPPNKILRTISVSPDWTYTNHRYHLDAYPIFEDEPHMGRCPQGHRRIQVIPALAMWACLYRTEIQRVHTSTKFVGPSARQSETTLSSPITTVEDLIVLQTSHIVPVMPWCTYTSAVNSLHNCTCSARAFFF